jgi:hypothetical protein
LKKKEMQIYNQRLRGFKTCRKVKFGKEIASEVRMEAGVWWPWLGYFLLRLQGRYFLTRSQGCISL